METLKNIVLFDGPARDNLLPLTFTRPVADLRIGISTLKEKWELLTHSTCSYHTEDYLSKKYPLKLESDNVFINGSVVPDEGLVKAIGKLIPEEALVSGETIIAYRSGSLLNQDDIQKKLKSTEYTDELISVQNSWDIFELNDKVLRDDFKRITAGRISQSLSSTNQVLGSENIFMEQGASVECATINALTGPVYIGRDVEIMEGSLVRGPLALCEHSTLKLGAKIYGATTIGPYCKVGGEVHNSVFTGYSSKAHDGYLGNAVLGEWCNLGADTNNSNLKNNYAKVKLWNYTRERFVQTGLQFCGLIMGDHSKCAINTMFNTGTVVGVSANIYGAGFPRNFVPSFCWGGPGGTIEYTPKKAFETAEIVLARRKIVMSEDDRAILLKVHELTEKFRKK